MPDQLKQALSTIAAIFAASIAFILVVAFYDAITIYNAVVMRVLAFCVVVLALSFVAYVSVNVLLAIEYRSIENEVFKKSHQELQIGSDSNKSGDELTDKILSLYDTMKFYNSVSLTQIALEVYGQKGNFYSNKVRNVLIEYGREI